MKGETDKPRGQAGRGWRGRLLLAAILAWPHLAAALPTARDLAADARLVRERRVPLLVLFSRADCPWCERARRSYLEPLQRDPAQAARVVVRQIDVDSDAPLVDFVGAATTHREFARARKAGLTPTIAVFDADGRAAAEPIVGFKLDDFYGALIERAIDEGLAKLNKDLR